MRQAWRNMRSRSRDGSPYKLLNPSYEGVKCDIRWATFEGFLAHPPAGEYSPGMVLSRIGDTGDYSPENCRWATKPVNIREMNERKMLRLADGRLAADVAAENGIKFRTWHSRIQLYGWSIEDAVTKKLQHQRA